MDKFNIKLILKKYIFNNFHLKILSLFVAFLLWLNISAKEVKRIEVESRVYVKNLPENFTIEKLEPKQVKVILEAKRMYLSSSPYTHVQVYVDGSILKKGENEVPVLIDKINLSKNISIVSVIPDSVVIIVKEKKKSKSKRRKRKG